jgi:hypothetical protein
VSINRKTFFAPATTSLFNCKNEILTGGGFKTTHKNGNNI